ncbi:hypothetical protein [Hymenobacter lapidiphilus]|uniref:Uncharacterized protein n=1 Tax=Hymenobacter lapidiphilus TaxID=2608003 RepID=A0A7Y7U3J5_9BACT|nr:hypothetical protein [Hymenobacter lapidiphilus]NVO29716.1 hypothetical protein [Hymenobacter lapidiphilus]
MSAPLTANEHSHLAGIMLDTKWASIARIMHELDSKHYATPGRTPSAGELRDNALQYLVNCIRDARTNGKFASGLIAGDFSYDAMLCSEMGIVIGLFCSFLIKGSDSSHVDL